MCTEHMLLLEEDRLLGQLLAGIARIEVIQLLNVVGLVSDKRMCTERMLLLEEDRLLGQLLAGIAKIEVMAVIEK